MVNSAFALVETGHEPNEREERRRTGRRHETVPVSIGAAGRQAIDGQTVNFSLGGVLLRAEARIPVTVTLNGKRYEGRIVRAVPLDSGETEYAIELERLLRIEP